MTHELYLERNFTPVSVEDSTVPGLLMRKASVLSVMANRRRCLPTRLDWRPEETDWKPINPKP